MLKFLQRLALDFPYICLYFFPGLSYRHVKKILTSGPRSSSACKALIFFFSRFLRSEALVYNSYLFQNSRFTEII